MDPETRTLQQVTIEAPRRLTAFSPF